MEKKKVISPAGMTMSKETDNDAVMEKVDNEGNILGFSILKVSELNKFPLSVSLKSSVA